MKVLHIELGRHLYGGARQVVYLLDGCPDAELEQVLVCAPGAAIADAVDRHLTRVCPVAFGGDADLGFIPRLARLLRQERPDLVHVHSRRGDLSSLLAARLAGIPCVLSRRVDNPPRWIDRRVKFPLSRKIITISDGIREVLLGSGETPEHVTSVRSAVDTVKYAPSTERAAVRASFDVGDEQIAVAVIAQLIPRKGHAVLFKVLPTLCERYPHLRVLIFGQGPLDGPLRADVRRLRLEGFVRFCGFRTDLDQILPALDLIVHPALMEGLGVSLLEAAACGIPIIASRAGGMPEIVVDGVNGLLVPPGDEAALATAIDRLLAAPDLGRACGAAGRARVLELFSIERMVAGNHRVYRELLTKG